LGFFKVLGTVHFKHTNDNARQNNGNSIDFKIPATLVAERKSEEQRIEFHFIYTDSENRTHYQIYESVATLKKHQNKVVALLCRSSAKGKISCNCDIRYDL